MVHHIPKTLPPTVSRRKNNFYELFHAYFFFFTDLKEGKKRQSDQDFIYLIYVLNLSCI